MLQYAHEVKNDEFVPASKDPAESFLLRGVVLVQHVVYLIIDSKQ